MKSGELMRALHVRYFDGLQPYVPIWQAMRERVAQRPDHDELWVVEHSAVYTVGQAGDMQHLLQNTSIPVIRSDRGGQITYHGPGQLLFYTLFNLEALQISVHDLVHGLERSVIAYLADHQIEAHSKPEAPGVYIDINEKKICSIGLRVRRHFSYHGLAFNVNVDLGPFESINPCGAVGLKMTNLSEYCAIESASLKTGVTTGLLSAMSTEFKYIIEGI